MTRKRIFDIIQIGKEKDIASRAFDIAISATIILNVMVLFLLTFDELKPLYPLFHGIENVTLVIFVIEYILRIWTADYLFPGDSRGKAILKFLRSYDGIVDLLTILPFFFLSGFIAFRMLRVVRIFHLFRINASFDSFNVIRSVLYEKKSQLASSFFIIFILMMASSLCMYSAEHAAQPEVFDNAFSGMWWSVSAMLTVGYGDVYPITPLGRVIAIIIAFLGVGLVAIPTGIISAGFVEQYNRTKDAEKTPELELNTLLIDIDSAWVGLTVQEIQKNYREVVVLVNRGKKSFAPKDGYHVHVGDALVVFHENTEV